MWYDAARDVLLVLPTQHGSGTYRLLGEIRGNIAANQISWLGRVDAKTGKVRTGWYFHAAIPGTPRDCPKLASNTLHAVRTDAHGRIHLLGESGPLPPLTPGAYQDLPKPEAGGRHAVLMALAPDSLDVQYSTLIRGSQLGEHGQAIGAANLTRLAVTPQCVYAAGWTNAPGFPTGPQPPWAHPQLSGTGDCTLVWFRFEDSGSGR